MQRYNELYGCLEADKQNCLRCDNMEDLYECTECKKGYNKTEYGFCLKIESNLKINFNTNFYY